MSGSDEYEPPIIRDRRRLDPVTGEVRATAADAAPAPGSAAEDASAADPGPAGDGGDAARVAELETSLAERTADLQRVQAEYVNYRRRVDRDRDAVREHALANVLTGLLPVLDDIGRARDHEKLSGGFRAVGDALEATVTKLGLERFGEVGEPFDPTVHEALMHSYSHDVAGPTCVQVLQPGYRVGLRVLRPARVAVAEPEHPVADEVSDEAAEPVDIESPDGSPDEQ